jgi:putative transcriptional regulator
MRDPSPARAALAAKRKAVARPGIGGVIKAAREQAGLSQEQLAQKLGVTRQTVGSWERGKTQPSLTMIALLCKLLDINVTFDRSQP